MVNIFLLCWGSIVKSLLIKAAVFCAFPMLVSAQSEWKLPLGTSTDQAASNSGMTGWAVLSTPPYVRSASGRKLVQKSSRPHNFLFKGGTVVATGFPGIQTIKPYVYRDGRTRIGDAQDYLFIDPNGVSANLLLANGIGFGMNGTELTNIAYDKILARDVGLVFGIAIDQEKNRNLYLTATSTFGLHIVGQDENNDRVADRLYSGQDRAKWMSAHWGNHPNAGPGSVWRVDGETGQISLFANIELDGVANSGPGLGNIVFDGFHNQLLVSDMDTGMIHRLDMHGNNIEHFDHGVTGRSADQRSIVKFDPENRLNIESADFDVEDPKTWSFSESERRIWGMAVHGERLFYAVAEGPEIWSVGLDKLDGHFLNDARWELTVSDEQPDFEVSDMVFDARGGMILAQRGARRGDYTFEKFSNARRATVLRYTYEYPQDPTTPSVWVKTPQKYAVGFSHQENNTTGGVDVGPGYDENGDWDYRNCRGSLWNTGEALRNSGPLKLNLTLGANLDVAGLQVQPADFTGVDNSPPWLSYFVDYDGEYPKGTRAGHIGDVEVVGCQGGAIGSGDDAAENGDPNDTSDEDTDDDGDDNSADDDNDDPNDPPACLESFVQTTCDISTGTYQSIAVFTPLVGGIDRLKLVDHSGALTGMPADISSDDVLSLNLGGLALGQPAQVSVCGYNSAQKITGKPYDCCTINLSLTLPNLACEKE